MAEATVMTKYNERLDQICYRHYGSTDKRIVETVLNQNPGLDSYGILLPMGVTIVLPVITTPKNVPKTGNQIFLWSS